MRRVFELLLVGWRNGRCRPPRLPRAVWDALGDLVASHEKNTFAGSMPGECWITLRLDGSNFSRVVKKMRRGGLVDGDGYSVTFEQVMQRCLLALMKKFNCKVGCVQRRCQSSGPPQRPNNPTARFAHRHTPHASVHHAVRS